MKQPDKGRKADADFEDVGGLGDGIRRDQDSTVGPLEIKDEDLLIVDEQGNYCRVTKAQYEAKKVDESIPEIRAMIAQMEELVSGQGVVLAEIPLGALEGANCACYLVNLEGFGRTKAKPVAGPAPAGPSPQ